MLLLYKEMPVNISVVSTSEPLFLASDIARCLEIQVKTVSRFLKDNLRSKDYRTIPSGQGRPSYYVTEAGVYDMIFCSKTEKARDFRYWIFEEVLPAICRDGAYVSPDISQAQAIALKEKVERILDAPDPWKKMYEKEFCERVFTWFGAQFYWDFCYFWMNAEERCKINRLNPDRKQRIHQYIEPETRERLKPRICELNALVGSNISKEGFLVAYQNLYGVGWQGELL